MSKQAGIYVRISLDRTGKAAGVKRQEQDCRKLVAERGWQAVEVYTDNDVSASKSKPRPSYQRLLRDIEAGKVNAVVAWHPDRLYRRLLDLEGLINLTEQHKVAIATVKAGDVDLTTASGRMQARILASVAKHETERTAERIERWHESRVEQGLPHGGGRRPFGYEWNKGTWRIREEEAVAVRRIAKHLIAGRSLSSLVRLLNMEGTTTANGKRWANGTVRKLMCNPTIAGLRHHKRTETTTTGNWKGIITPTQRELLLALFNDPSRPKRGGGPTDRKRLLSGLLVCAKCGQKIYGDGVKAYACSKQWKGCGGIRIAKSPLEDWVYWEATEHISELSRAGLLVERDYETEDEPLVEERLRLQQKRDEFAVKLANDLIDDRGYKVGVHALDERIRAVESKMAATVRMQPVREEDLQELVIMPEVGRDFTSNLAPDHVIARHERLRSVIERIEVSSSSRRGIRWEPSRVNIVWRHPLPKRPKLHAV